MKKIIRNIFFVVLGLIFLVISVYFLVFGQDIIAIMNTTDQFMKAMSNGDTETAYSLLAIRAQKRTPFTEFEQYLKENEFNYKDYEKMCVIWIEFEPFFLHQEVKTPPLGRTASIESCLYYKETLKSGKTTVFLEKENGTWRILTNYIGAYYKNAK